MRKLSKLRVLRLGGRSLDAVAGLESLITLQTLEADFRGVAERPSLRQLTRLQSLEIRGWNLEGLGELGNLAMLHTLAIRNCSGVDELPEIRSLTRVQNLKIWNCEFSGVSAVSELIELENLSIRDCEKLERLPNLEKVTTLRRLDIRRCPKLRGWNCEVKEPALEPLTYFPALRTMGLSFCEGITTLSSARSLTSLRSLKLEGCIRLHALSDLGMFPALEELSLQGCSELTRLSCSVRLPALKWLDATGCENLTGDDLGQLRTLCPQCEIECDALPVAQVDSKDVVRSGALESGVGKKRWRWRWRAVVAGGVILALVWIIQITRRRSTCWLATFDHTLVKFVVGSGDGV